MCRAQLGCPSPSLCESGNFSKADGTWPVTSDASYPAFPTIVASILTHCETKINNFVPQSCKVAAQRVAWWSHPHCEKCPLIMNPMACWTSGIGVSLASRTGQRSRADFPMACMAAASAGAWSPRCGTWVLASVSSLLPSSEQRQCSQQEVEGGSVDTRSINSPTVSESSKHGHPVQTVPGLNLGFCPSPSALLQKMAVRSPEESLSAGCLEDACASAFRKWVPECGVNSGSAEFEVCWALSGHTASLSHKQMRRQRHRFRGSSGQSGTR